MREGGKGIGRTFKHQSEEQNRMVVNQTLHLAPYTHQKIVSINFVMNQIHDKQLTKPQLLWLCMLIVAQLSPITE